MDDLIHPRMDSKKRALQMKSARFFRRQDVDQAEGDAVSASARASS